MGCSERGIVLCRGGDMEVNEWFGGKGLGRGWRQFGRGLDFPFKGGTGTPFATNTQAPNID